MGNIAENIEKIQFRIVTACRKYGRPESSVRLVAVSKTHPVEQVRLAIQSGQTDFGENYAQEAIAKIESLGRAGLVWHFIGPIQSNKTRLLAESFDWVHTIDSLRIAKRLSDARPEHCSTLNVCLQVNISGEASKSGISPEQLPDLARSVAALPRLHLRGLMVIPAPETDFARQRESFARTRQLLEQLNQTGLALDTLSMGMSDDLEAAIAEGATIVRVGTAIFGSRQTGPGNRVTLAKL
jgi:pyridoxal phosphate enzyme (YggS family)